MSVKNIVVLANKNDGFNLIGKIDDTLFLSATTNPNKTDFIKHNIIRILLSKQYPSESCLDFLNMAMAVYTADQLIPRNRFGHFNWSRLINIYLPVLDLKVWQERKSSLEEMLSFLSGDRWVLHFRSRKKHETVLERSKKTVDLVSLFSGGLDSYTGAVDFLTEGKTIALVGHHKAGANELPYQRNLIAELRKEYTPEKLFNYLFLVQPQKVPAKEFDGESSQRARSILFIALGITVANSFGPEVPLMVPENGLISLNVPLTSSRLGSLSTRTTHPYFFYLLNENLTQLGIHNSIQNPYKFLTKGEMLAQSKNLELLKSTAKNTVSCSKPGHYKRWNRGKNIHCGHCTPCIIRRAAMKAIGVDDPSEYEHDIIRSRPDIGEPQGRDFYAFKSAILKASKKKTTLLNIASSGPLPGGQSELKQLKDVYVRGIHEVDTLFNK